ncbi:hypothetical protein JCM10450v2_004954 [Rhodotorula kratochvilovae]
MPGRNNSPGKPDHSPSPSKPWELRPRLLARQAVRGTKGYSCERVDHDTKRCVPEEGARARLVTRQAVGGFKGFECAPKDKWSTVKYCQPVKKVEPPKTVQKGEVCYKQGWKKEYLCVKGTSCELEHKGSTTKKCTVKAPPSPPKTTTKGPTSTKKTTTKAPTSTKKTTTKAPTSTKKTTTKAPTTTKKSTSTKAPHSPSPTKKSLGPYDECTIGDKYKKCPQKYECALVDWKKSKCIPERKCR